MLGTENYGTSFQSLMSPMYNVNANYSMNGYGMGAGYGLGYGGGYMGGLMTPMANVGVGQFNADYLIKDDSKNNNYYTRPIATHKKKDETGTILGIGAAALATTALLVAACKGKAPVTYPPIGPTGGKRPYVKPEVTERIVDPSRLLPSPSTVTQMPTSQGYTRTLITGNGRTGAMIDDATKAIKPGTRLDNVTTNVPTYLNPNTPGYNYINDIASKDAILKGLGKGTQNMPAVSNSAGFKYVPQGNPNARLMFSAPMGTNGKQLAINLLEKNPAVKTSPISFNGHLAGVNVYATPLQQGAQATQGVQQLANGTQSSQKLLTYTPANQTGKLNLGPVESYLPQANKGFTLPAQEVKGLLPSPQTVSTAQPRTAVLNYQRHGARYNRHPQVTADVLKAEFGNLGLNIDTKAFAKLTNKEQRFINNLVSTGTPAQLKALTCDPVYQHLFSLI